MEPLKARGELRDSMLRVRRRAVDRGVAGGDAGGLGRVMTCDDFIMAALTVESMPSSLGRRLEGICRSSYRMESHIRTSKFSVRK